MYLEYTHMHKKIADVSGISKDIEQIHENYINNFK